MTTETQQECPMSARPQQEHDWLQKLVGEWTYEAVCSMGPDQPPAKATGIERVRSLGGLWIVAEGHGETPMGDQATTLITIGYDPQKGQYVGSCIASVMTHHWVYGRGELNDADGTLTLYAEGPVMTPGAEGTMATYRDVIEFRSDDHRVMTSHVLSNDGDWTQVMTSHYHRKQS